MIHKYILISKKLYYLNLTFFIFNRTLTLYIMDFITKKTILTYLFKATNSVPIILKPLYLMLLVQYDLNEFGINILFLPNNRKLPGKIKTFCNFLVLLNKSFKLKYNKNNLC